ncbi:uncharacterized protein LOC132295927 [Cornus florida]|uniref:uncharacterized protein LOC132295927 n=1 Tax=Cornus florida TaxID=4283 RepID=UPI00289B8E96|nr:uncharacterized protein LOC132295927 [Cornus florida]
MYDDDEEEEILVLIAAVYEYYHKHFDKQRCTDSMLQGEDYIFEILNGHGDRCNENFRMYPNTFRALCRELKLLGLKNSTFVTVEEQVAIFLLTLYHNERNRVIAERFQHSTSTISYRFHAILKLRTKIIVPPDLNEIPKQIKNNLKFYPYFKNYVGAIDGTHIHVVVPVDKQIPFRGKKGDTTQNVMAMCSFDMKLTYILAGWEGSANDSKILNECIQNEDLNFPSPPEAYCTLHNFIRFQGKSDEIFYCETPESSTSQNEPDMDDIVEVISATNTQMRQMDIYRDRIVNLIWEHCNH